uniref:Uncharacterized protein n=1 Tax=Sphaerodactylus townsendi TaxID=933632 RepID=A0ACB8EYM2_9SAUR
MPPVYSLLDLIAFRFQVCRSKQSFIFWSTKSCQVVTRRVCHFSSKILVKEKTGSPFLSQAFCASSIPMHSRATIEFSSVKSNKVISIAETRKPQSGPNFQLTCSVDASKEPQIINLLESYVQN